MRIIAADALVNVVVIVGQRRSGVADHLVLQRRYVFGCAVRMENNVEQVGFRGFGLGGFGRRILRDGELLDQGGVRNRDEPEYAGALLAHGVFGNHDRQRHAVDRRPGEPVCLAQVDCVGPFAVGRHGEHDRGAFIGNGSGFGGKVGGYREIEVFPFGRLVVFTRCAENQCKGREQEGR